MLLSVDHWPSGRYVQDRMNEIHYFLKNRTLKSVYSERENDGRTKAKSTNQAPFRLPYVISKLASRWGTILALQLLCPRDKGHSFPANKWVSYSSDHTSWPLCPQMYVDSRHSELAKSPCSNSAPVFGTTPPQGKINATQLRRSSG